MSNSRPLTENILLPHPAFEYASTRLEQCFFFATLKAEAEGVAIIGPSGSGKTSVLLTFLEQHPPTRDANGMNIPVVYASVPSSPTVKSLAGVILEALHASDSEKGTENEKNHRIKVLLRETGTRMLMLDEFQHFDDRRTRKYLHHVADWLKILMDQTRITVVIAGLSLAAAPIVSVQGEVTGGVVSVTDIDQQKRSETALIQNEKLAAVGRLAASISHEINNPLEAVTNLLYLARTDGSVGPKIQSLLDSPDDELSRVSQIVSHTLRFHRQSTSPRAISADELIGPSLGLFAGRLQNSNIVLIDQRRSMALATCFEGEIRQVLSNLVVNAIDAMKTGGRLTIRTKDTHSWITGAAGIRITVADTGHGMDAHISRQIFEAFYTTKGINGTGLGLWISRGIMEKHHGDLKVRSSVRPGKSGTVFTLFLPLNADPKRKVRDSHGG